MGMGMFKSNEELRQIAKRVRKNIIRMLTKAGSGHPGGSLSMVEILVELFYNWIKRTPENALAPDRHRLVLSKGHGVPALYAVFAELGLIKEEDLWTLRKLGSPLQGHPDRLRLPYVEASTGSLGQGLSVAVGMAMASKLDGDKFRVYAVVGDGELQEGQMWEAIEYAPRIQLDTLTAILDYNQMQLDGYLKDIGEIYDIKNKIEAFGWKVLEVDGHNFDDIRRALNIAYALKGKPTFIIAYTIKGKCVSFMEFGIKWHGAAPSEEEAEKAIKEIEENC